MRGSALIFNSLDELDPETLDKLDDLTSLDSLDLEDDFQKESQIYLSKNIRRTSEQYETRNSANMTHSVKNDSFQTQPQNSNSNSEKENHYSSSPLNKSNYFEGTEKVLERSRSKSQYFIPLETRQTISASIQRPVKNENSNGARLPLSRIGKASTSLIKTNSIVPDNCRHENSGGFSRFLFRSSREDKNKFDLNNLSPQLREETKRIYVY